ncbi:AEC family transporter [Ancylobacter pratisalsi]|uniref:AEC family transporter n=1 Tax=Ancylobacter pratisalsi TaxID=1745854 RepID=A0A6P1YM66_9HYPH|nr:AEC family transporter [Ancylobacter pratisalsi]QIB34527.1 AEC family transporter [Ancylobacter pratisalsi]
MHTILMALAPLFFVMALGYIAGRIKIIDNHQVGGLNSLTMDFALPSALFVAIASAPRSEMIAQAPLFLLLSAVMLIVFCGWYVVARRYLAADHVEAALQALTVAFPNLAGVGLPVAAAVLGPMGTIQVAIALAAGSVVVSPITLVIVELYAQNGTAPDGGNERLLRALRRALTKPVVVAPLAGIALSLADIQLGPVLTASLSLIGQAAAGAALFLTGLVLSAQSFRPRWRVMAATLAADIIRPLLAVATTAIFAVPMETARVTILLAAIPSGFFGILFAVSYGRDSATVGSIVIASTLFSAVTMALIIALLFPA